MKILKSLTLMLVLVGLTIFTNCGPGTSDDAVPDAFVLQADKFVGNWTLVADGAVLESIPDANYTGLTLTVEGNQNGGTLQTNNSTLTDTSDRVWPDQSNWVFSSSTGDTENPAAQYALREADNVVVGITVTNDELELTFLVPESASRSMGISGNWTFTFEAAGAN